MTTWVWNRRGRELRIPVKWLLFGAVALLVVLNVAYMIFARPGAKAIRSTGVIDSGTVVQAVPLPNERAVALTIDNHLYLLTHGKPGQNAGLDSTITALATSSDGRVILGGTTDNQVILWDDQLNEQTRFTVGGRVTDLQMDETGDIIVAYGIGRYTGKFWIGRFNQAGAELLQKRVGPDINVVEADTDAAYYATVNGKLLGWTKDGSDKWDITMNHPVVVLERTSQGNLLAGDERGFAYLVDPNGSILWTQKLSEYRIRMAAEIASAQQIVVGDDDGAIFLLDAFGGQILSKMVSSSGPVQGVVQSSRSAVTMLTSAGQGLTIDLRVAMRAQRNQGLNTVVIIGNVLLVLIVASTAVASVPRLRVPALRIGRQLAESRTAYLLLLPSFAMIILFNYIPTTMGLYYSFTNFNLAEPIKFIGLENFRRLWTDSFFWSGVTNMLLILTTSIAKTLTMPLLVAELVFWLHGDKLKYWMRLAFIIPSIVPGVVGIMLWKTMYDPRVGLINEILHVLNLDQWQHAWLANEQTAIWAIIFAGFPWIGTFAFLIYLGGLLNINRELFDACAIDGANALKRFLKIELPLLRPQLRLLLFFAFLGGVQEYGGVWIFTQGGPGHATYVPGLQMFLQTSKGEYGYAAAIGLVLALVVLGVTVARFRFGQNAENT